MMVVSAGAARAESLDVSDWYRQIEALVQSLIGEQPADHEIITPPGNIDPQMALVPPSDGRMRVIVPPDRFKPQ
jgi:hypothetical protein